MAIPRWLFHVIFFSIYGLWSSVFALDTPFLPMSFFFDWNLPSQPLPIPVTAQCDTIHITWGRSSATGPNPVSPYFLQVYTSTFLFPLIIAAGSGLSFDWAVPFAPGTIYQICMFDTNGNTGGCQAAYTVIPSNSTSCTNVTTPSTPLDVDAIVEDGPGSRYGWVNQCTDISVTPKNGTPPYIFTVAPTLHPPYNITSNGTNSMNWTVSLSWASQFFISVVDASGNSWANGPLHSGGGGPTDCLAGLADNTTKTTSGDSSTGIAVGAGVGGLVLGALAGVVIAYIFMQRRRQKERERFVTTASSSPTAGYFDPPQPGASQYRVLPAAAGGGQVGSSIGTSNPSSHNTMLNRLTRPPDHYQVEPYVMPFEDGTLPGQPARRSNSAAAPTSPLESPEATGASSSHVYVVHHDGGRAPVSVYHQDGTEVVELPPRYNVTGSDPGTQSSATATTDSRNKPPKRR